MSDKVFLPDALPDGLPGATDLPAPYVPDCRDPRDPPPRTEYLAPHPASPGPDPWPGYRDPVPPRKLPNEGMPPEHDRHGHLILLLEDMIFAIAQLGDVVPQASGLRGLAVQMRLRLADYRSKIDGQVFAPPPPVMLPEERIAPPVPPPFGPAAGQAAPPPVVRPYVPPTVQPLAVTSPVTPPRDYADEKRDV